MPRLAFRGFPCDRSSKYPLRERLLEAAFVVSFVGLGIVLPLVWLVLMGPLRLWRAIFPPM